MSASACAARRSLACCQRRSQGSCWEAPAQGLPAASSKGPHAVMVVVEAGDAGEEVCEMTEGVEAVEALMVADQARR